MRNPKMYSLTYVRCLVLRLHKIDLFKGHLKFVKGQNLKLLRVWWNVPQIVCINKEIQKKNSLYTSEADLLKNSVDVYKSKR